MITTVVIVSIFNTTIPKYFLESPGISKQTSILYVACKQALGMSYFEICFRTARACLQATNTSDVQFCEEVETFACSTVDQLPATAQRLQEIIEVQRNDEVCMQVRGYCQAGWPAYMPHQPLLRPYWENRAHLAVVDDLLLYDERIVIPQALRLDILDCIHRGLLGISNCRARPQMSVWWPGLSAAIEIWSKHAQRSCPNPKSPSLMLSSFRSLPLERMSMNFVAGGRT